jgi:hypothetical protein
VNDDQLVKEYRKRVNRILFGKNEQEFINGLFIRFNEPFTNTIWEKQKKQADEDESKYFKSHEDY